MHLENQLPHRKVVYHSRRSPCNIATSGVAITPLILCLANENMKQVWFADDAASARGQLEYIKHSMIGVTTSLRIGTE